MSRLRLSGISWCMMSKMTSSSSSSRISLFTQRRLASTNATEDPEKPIKPPLEACCQSGCINCVYLIYAKDLMNYYEKKYSNSKQGIDKAIEEIENAPGLDPSLKAYLTIEINMKYGRFL